MEAMSTQEQQLCEFLKIQPRVHKNRYTDAASNSLLQSLFWSLAGGRPEYLRLYFPDNTRPSPSATWKLRKAQGGADGDEFTEAARGKVCGHIFKGGEVTYRCKTCSSDDTCVLCSRCYDSSDHTGHMVYISVSMGNSGCCDCGDLEAWRVPVNCSIHTAYDEGSQSQDKGKAPGLPLELVEAIRMTIGRAFDYICDVISCSPEQLRLPKSRQNILEDERMSRLGSEYYNGDIVEEPCEFALLLWNDEKHTVYEVRDQVARACKTTLAEGMEKAYETDNIGRSIIKYSFDVDELLHVSRIIEQIKVTVTIRSARDTFREQMCGTIIEWLTDISGCSVGPDHNILRQVICEEMLKKWSYGSQASNRDIGMKGIDDHEIHENHSAEIIEHQAELLRRARARIDPDDEDSDNNDFTVEEDEEPEEDEGMATDDEEDDASNFAMAVHQYLFQPGSTQTDTDPDGDIEMTADDAENSPLEHGEATAAGFPPPPPPPPIPQRQTRDRDLTPSDSDTAEVQPFISHTVYAKANLEIPKTPANIFQPRDPPKPARYWLETSQAFGDTSSIPLHENLWERVRLDWMILFDLRMWKKVRIDLRDLYISTVVSIPEFKRVLGLRFAGLYTMLAQLYLIADREPEHSIINISLQMLTTPTITAEIVERGNFLTNLMAILYTFLTTRQVGHPHEISPNATLAFDSGSVTNRRMYHFFLDLKYLFGSEHVQEQLRTQERYIMQFLDLVKLHQGICPNTRAVGEHVEYETDAWISASLITREINRLCREFSDSFKWSVGEDHTYISRAIRLAAKAVILNSLGTERKRFDQAEIKDEIKFKKVGDYEFDTTENANSVHQHSVVKFVVESQPISFHHALHYTLSWLIECGKSMPREQLIQLLSFTTLELLEKPRAMGQRAMTSLEYSPEDHLMAAFDYPLRVCAWLAQMKASMWVRNGMSLRHQHSTYRGVSQRDVSHHRDIFLLQTAMVVCPPARVLVSIIDRYGLEHWMKGLYEQKSDGTDDGQVLDVAEDLIHLLIVLISDRTSLITTKDETDAHVLAMRRDITHVLCFKPLSFTEICSKLPDKFHDQEECQDILDEMTTFKPPEGLSDVGTFELKEQFLEDVDPYISHYNKNQREESENAYKTWMAKKTGRPASEIVFEPRLRLIESGVFSDLAAFTRAGIFAQIIYYALLYPVKAQELTPTVPATRVEAFLQVVLHLVLIAIAEDKTDEDEMSEESLQSFVYIALTSTARSNFIPNAPASRTIAAVLEILSQKEEFKACHPKITLVLRRMRQKRPRNFEIAFARLGVPVDRISTASPANHNALEDREKKRRAALERQAKVMAQFQQQQKNFLDNQGDIDWGEDDGNDNNVETEGEDQKTYWHYPTGTCILCQEETKDGRLYGTFALLANSTVLRQTPFEEPDFVREVLNTPSSLDRTADSIRPFGVAGENREEVLKVTPNGAKITTERQFIGKGFPSSATRVGPVSVGCGHIMHYKCFDVYYDASHRRHLHQIARHHPEMLELNEFVCPLCKALGNAFLPIIWSPKEELSLQSFQLPSLFDEWISTVAGPDASPRAGKIDSKVNRAAPSSRSVELFMDHNNAALATPLAAKMSELLVDAWRPSSPTTPPLFGTIIPAVVTAGWDDPGPSNAAQPVSPVSPMAELVGIYERLRRTIESNKLPSHHSNGPINILSDTPQDFRHSDTLAHALGYSISAVEIQQRGVASPSGMTLLDSIPQQALTHLKILAETAATYVSTGGIRFAGDNQIAQEFSEDYETQHSLLFMRNPYTSGRDADSTVSNRISESLLNRDIFIFLAECSLCLVPVDNLDIMHVVRLCYLAEIVKVIMKMGRNRGLLDIWSSERQHSNPILETFRRFCLTIRQFDVQHLDSDEGDALNQPTFEGLESNYEFVKKYALAFLRKVTVLLHVRHGVVFNNHISSNPDADELDRLTEALRLPKLDEMFASTLQNSTLFSLIDRWITYLTPQTKDETPAGSNLNISHPAIAELIGLPKNFDALMEETMKRRCPTTGKDVTDPMLCLFCGEIFCGQSICCLKELPAAVGGRLVQVGGAQQHMRKCQKNVGLFINIRKCCVYYLYHMSGSWMVAPYIDRYGEVDPGLRHSRQLFLNQKRYDALLRTVWLSHGIPSVISRRLEMDINNGGWETI
ncbi:ClpS-like protein [Venustampulla echinocandica]|uniref:E3 ubiquitin-protein ligase n=1 Tax=Venustampulla echinocandica TaxID=2656787 RepID=A0A370THW9_9HELO|nr:ClpS-like protein [Venustampulla echinocandica]RDL34795.1 ClpS-like protein [Venustampulla echinocandica]